MHKVYKLKFYSMNDEKYFFPYILSFYHICLLTVDEECIDLKIIRHNKKAWNNYYVPGSIKVDID